MIYVLLGILALWLLLGWKGVSRVLPPPRSHRRFQNAELVKVLVSLEDSSLDELFELYKQKFGPGPARYARRTYQKWIDGKVRPNRQTFDRFLVHLPQVMSFDLKCEVVRKLRAEYCAKDNHELTVHTDDWQDVLEPLVNQIIDKAYSAELPGLLQERLSWLSDNETQIADAILTQSQIQESKNCIALLRQEFSNIEYVLHNANGRPRVTHTMTLPYGTIRINIKRR